MLGIIKGDIRSLDKSSRGESRYMKGWNSMTGIWGKGWG